MSRDGYFLVSAGLVACYVPILLLHALGCMLRVIVIVVDVNQGSDLEWICSIDRESRTLAHWLISLYVTEYNVLMTT